jgi:hypothetical protein
MAVAMGRDGWYSSAMGSKGKAGIVLAVVIILSAILFIIFSPYHSGLVSPQTDALESK